MPTPFTPDPAPEVIPATAEAGGYLVASLSRPGAFWLVRIDRGRAWCGCERGTQIAAAVAETPTARLLCRHARILIAWQAAQDRANSRPSFGPANTAALVD